MFNAIFGITVARDRFAKLNLIRYVVAPKHLLHMPITSYTMHGHRATELRSQPQVHLRETHLMLKRGKHVAHTHVQKNRCTIQPEFSNNSFREPAVWFIDNLTFGAGVENDQSQGRLQSLLCRKGCAVWDVYQSIRIGLPS